MVILRRLRRLLPALLLRIRVARLSLLARIARSSVVGRYGPVISLTSFGKRINKVYLAIESIAQGTLLPSRLILWLDDDTVFRNPPTALIRLKQRGLEIRLARNYGPHTKYYPYLESGEKFESPLVTADDDVVYPQDWLEKLLNAFLERPDVVNCYRARVAGLQNESLVKYEQWPMCESTDASFRHFATGVSGVIYPPKLLMAIRNAGRVFEHCCPKADDIWLHVQALRAGYKVRQFVPKAMDFPILPGTQAAALHYSNSEAGNDEQAWLTYGRCDLEKMCHEGRITSIELSGKVTGLR